MRSRNAIAFAAGLLLASLTTANAQQPHGRQLLADYFQRQTTLLKQQCLAEIHSRQQWEQRREELRRQLLEMLGLWPLPQKTDLHAQVTGTVDRDKIVVEKLHFQSLPGLYVTANLYRPAEVSQPLPTVLYVCGHGRVAKDGVSYGNKVHYQHHGAWLARHGYVCLMIDTLQLGEIEGIHHGTYRLDRWWWINHGYTPAGVEAWNCVRALDYLSTRPDVDMSRVGVTGRSGGGAYSWWIAAIDDRIQVAVPVAGITDLHNHVVDGCVEGHCDCMYLVNTYRWDYPQVAALVAPRPLLISNSDRDSIFPLDGVYRTYQQVRRIYELYEAGDKVALNITAGPHQDTQELRTHAFRWLNLYLKEDDQLLRQPAEPLFEPKELKVLDAIPSDQRNTVIDREFVTLRSPVVPISDADRWQPLRSEWLDQLSSKVFRGWPSVTDALDVRHQRTACQNSPTVDTYSYLSQAPFQLPLFVVRRDGDPVARVVLQVLGSQDWPRFAHHYAWAINASDQTRPSTPATEEATIADKEATAEEETTDRMPADQDRLVLGPAPGELLILVAPRGIGPTQWSDDPRTSTHIRRRFYLLGQTLDGQRIWDIRRAIQAIDEVGGTASLPLWLRGQGTEGALALYAALFEWNVDGLELIDLPSSHENGPYLLNVSRFVEMPQVVAMAADHLPIRLTTADADAWSFPSQLEDVLGSHYLTISAKR